MKYLGLSVFDGIFSPAPNEREANCFAACLFGHKRMPAMSQLAAARELLHGAAKPLGASLPFLATFSKVSLDAARSVFAASLPAYPGLTATLISANDALSAMQAAAASPSSFWMFAYEFLKNAFAVLRGAVLASVSWFMSLTPLGQAAVIAGIVVVIVVGGLTYYFLYRKGASPAQPSPQPTAAKTSDTAPTSPLRQTPPPQQSAPQQGSADDLGDALSCPITGKRFVDPVMTCDGQTYERYAIQLWFESGRVTSPLTGLPLENATLIPNLAMKRAVEQQQGH